MKKAFSMIELVFVLIILGIFSIGVNYANKYTQQAMDLDSFYEDIAGVIDYGIFDIERGYVSGVGGDCSSGISYTDISAIRVARCADLNSTMNIVTAGDELDGANSFFHGLEEYSTNGEGCKVYIDDKDTTSFYVYLECLFDYKNKSTEDIFITYMKNTFTTSFKGFDNLALDLNTSTGGTDTDGKVRVLFEK